MCWCSGDGAEEAGWIDIKDCGCRNDIPVYDSWCTAIKMPASSSRWTCMISARRAA